MTPPPASQSPVLGSSTGSPQTQLQQQQIIPIGQQVQALVTSNSSHQQQSSVRPLASAIPPPTPTPPPNLSAPTSSSSPSIISPLMINSNSSGTLLSSTTTTTVPKLTATKSLPTATQLQLQQLTQQQQQASAPQTLLIQTNKDGQQILVSHPGIVTAASTASSGIRTAPGGGTSMPASLVLQNSRAPSQMTMAMSQAGATLQTTGPNGQLFQIIQATSGSPSRPTLSAVSVSATGQQQQQLKQQSTTLSPRVVQLPINVRTGGHVTTVRPGSFNATPVSVVIK